MAEPEPRWLRRLGDPAIFAWACAWLMVLLVVGTIDQKFHGLHAAQERYFSSWILWVFEMLPLPGGRTTLAVVFVCLLAFCFTRRAMRNPGLFVTHIGALLLLLGGFLTDMLRIEGSLALGEGQSGAMTRAERDLELAVIDESPAEHDLVIAFRQGMLAPGGELAHDRMGFSVTVLELHRNAERTSDGELRALPEEPTAQDNRPAIRLRLSGSDRDGEHLLLADDEPLRLRAVGRDYRLRLRPARYLLPFALRLEDVEATMHPGTTQPASFVSTVTVIEPGDEERRAVISMNKPLRLHGHTVYQSHYDRGDGSGERSGFAIAYDPYPVFSFTYAYLSSGIMALGLIVHLSLLARRRLAREESA